MGRCPSTFPARGSPKQKRRRLRGASSVLVAAPSLARRRACFGDVLAESQAVFLRRRTITTAKVINPIIAA